MLQKKKLDRKPHLWIRSHGCRGLFLIVLGEGRLLILRWLHLHAKEEINVLPTRHNHHRMPSVGMWSSTIRDL